MKTKHLPEQIRPEYDLPDSIIGLINSQVDTSLDFSKYFLSLIQAIKFLT